jgi:hypothetical protein
MQQSLAKFLTRPSNYKRIDWPIKRDDPLMFCPVPVSTASSSWRYSRYVDLANRKRPRPRFVRKEAAYPVREVFEMADVHSIGQLMPPRG